MVTGSRIERKKYQNKRNNSAPKPSSVTPSRKQISNKRQNPSKKVKDTPTKWFRKMFRFIILMGLLVFLAGAGLFTYYASQAPEISRKDLQGQVASKIYDRDGQLIKTLGGQNRQLLKEGETPQVLKDAVLAIEDARFYSHKGIDPIRILGALVSNLKARSIAQGGSTITQQLIKLSVFSTDYRDQTLERKAQEAWLSIKLEQDLSKEEILTLYLNKLFYSNNIYGAKTAAKSFFGKEISEINLAEAALLAGIPQAPTDYDPYTNPSQAKERRDIVLTVMKDRKLISESDYQTAVNTSIESMLVPLTDNSLSETDLMIDAYLDLVAKEVQDKMDINIFTDGVEIYTNMQLSAQKHLYETIHNKHGQIFPDDKMQTAVSIIDVDTGQIYAVLGGRNQKVAMGLNRANVKNRSVGSTMKPLSAYGPAIEYLNYSTGTTVVDEPYQYTNGDEIYNYDFDYKGQQTIREALSGSRNIPALKTLQKVGTDKAYSFLQKMDINLINNQQRELVEANAIGGEISVIQLAAAYATISNYGTYHQPYTVSKVVTQSGAVQTFDAQSRPAMKDSTAYMLTDILKGVPGNFASAAAIEGYFHAGKTGTTNYTPEQLAQLGLDSNTYAAPDGWYVGYTPQFAIATWVGYDNPLEEGNYLTLEETRIPQLVYHEMMTYVMQGVPIADWKQPESVVQVEIEKFTDPLKKASEFTPSHMRSKELFIKGSEPTQVSEAYRYIPAPTNFVAKYHEDTQSIDLSWDPINYEGTFELSINGQVMYTGKDNLLTLSNITEGDYDLQLRILVNGLSSDINQIHLSIHPNSSNNQVTTVDESNTLPPGMETTLDPNTYDPNNPYGANVLPAGTEPQTTSQIYYY